MGSYNEEQFKIDFPKTAVGKKILAETPEWMSISYSPFGTVDFWISPRENLSTIYVVPFFYVLKLLEKNPEKIADIGCGMNFFKYFIPEIIGIDPTDHPKVDIVDYFDDVYSKGHTDSFDCAMAINAIHFISLKDINKQLKSFSNIIKPGGRGFVTFNVERMIERTDEKDMIPDAHLSSYIKQQVDQALPNVLLYDSYIDNTDSDILNGNIRIVFEKEK